MADKPDKGRTQTDPGSAAVGRLRHPLVEIFFMYVFVLLAVYFVEALVQQPYGWPEFRSAWGQYLDKPDPQAQLTDLLNLSIYVFLGWFIWAVKYLVPVLALAAALLAKSVGMLEACAWWTVAAFGVALGAVMYANHHAWTVIHHQFFK